MNTSLQKNETTSAPAANPADVASIDAIIAAAYDVISGPAGQKRDWNRERSLFISGARLIPTSKRAGVNKIDNEGGPDVLDVEGYIARVEPYFQEQGFFEKEIARRTSSLEISFMFGARTSRDIAPMIPNRSCAESTAFSLYIERAAGGS